MTNIPDPRKLYEISTLLESSGHILSTSNMIEIKKQTQWLVSYSDFRALKELTHAITQEPLLKKEENGEYSIFDIPIVLREDDKQPYPQLVITHNWKQASA